MYNLNLSPPFISDDIMNSLCEKFFSFKSHPQNNNHVLSQVEKAYWHVRDQYIMKGHMDGMKMMDFIRKVLPHLKLNYNQTMWDDYKIYRSSLPTYGAVLLNKDLTKTVLVIGYRNTSWSFPKGKVEMDEDPVTCAAREVLEEIGLNITDMIDTNQYIQCTIFDKRTSAGHRIPKTSRLFIVTNVPEDTHFNKEQYEIQKIEWFDVSFLLNMNCLFLKSPPWNGKNYDESTFARFGMVMPFLSQLKEWIDDKFHHLGFQGIQKIENNFTEERTKGKEELLEYIKNI